MIFIKYLINIYKKIIEKIIEIITNCYITHCILFINKYLTLIQKLG